MEESGFAQQGEPPYDGKPRSIVKRWTASAIAAILLCIMPATVRADSAPPLHTMLEVEVNDHGQVVRVLHGDLSGNRAFDIMTIGNALQMWIREPSGRSITGLYRVTYDLNPHTGEVRRVPSLLKAGGNWGSKPGAVAAILGSQKKAIEEQVEHRLNAEAAAKKHAHATRKKAKR